ncbi:MAG: class II aldolase/adducin family protein [Actinobacteria bacterium]|jgi:L-fuculose-phosphate aldolase|nr:class II aldolase/adducin family protein [Actinomycetota bacterium]
MVLWTAKEMLRTNLVEGTAGNLGARLPDGNAVLTPSSLDYMEMTLDDLVITDLDGNVLAGERGPTTEKALHLSAMRMHDDIDATMHCHAKFATMFAVTRQPIPAVIEEVVVFIGGDVEVADYRTTGTDELAEEVAKRVEDRAAVLMANHGLFAVGKTPKDVLHIASLVERTAEIVWGARQIGEVVPIPDEVNQTFAGYYRFGRTGKF